MNKNDKEYQQGKSCARLIVAWAAFIVLYKLFGFEVAIAVFILSMYAKIET